MRRALVAALLVATAGCAAHRSPRISAEGGNWVATYRAELDAGGKERHHARLALWAAEPDRLHAELSGPVGGVRLMLDAGGGRACVVDPAAGTAYVGEETPAALFALTGVRIGVADAVDALLNGRVPEGASLERQGARGALPTRLTIRSGERALSLERIRVEQAHPAAPLGTGTPPKDATVRPLSDLAGASGEGT